MSDAVNKAPSFDEQVEHFKGFTTVDGEVRPENTAERGAKDAGKPAAPAAPRSAQDVLGARGRAADSAAEDGDEQDADAEEGAEETGEKAPEPKPDIRKPASDPQKRINQAVARQRSAERERDQAIALGRELSRRMEALEARLGGQDPALTRAPASRQSDGAPNPNDYQWGDTDSRYLADLARHEAREELRAEQEKMARARQDQERQQSAAAHEKAVQDFGARGAAKYQDFQETVLDSANAGEWPLSPVVGDLILTSDFGDDIAYFLATHHDEARRIANLTPAKQAAWFGQQEALLSSRLPDAGARVVPKATQAPPLPSARARGGGNRVAVTADTSDFAAFEAMARGGQS